MMQTSIRGMEIDLRFMAAEAKSKRNLVKAWKRELKNAQTAESKIKK